MTRTHARGAGAWRLLVDPPAAGAWNMAVDEAILERSVASAVAPTLRLYSWSRPTLSLGKAQALDGGPDLPYLRREEIDLVRRPTGGRAVLHADERTYTVCAPAGPPFAAGIEGTYEQIANALRVGLRRLGVRATIAPSRASVPRSRGLRAACFEVTSSSEITVDGRKLVGSAQLRRRSAFLQHGSILIRADGRLAAALGGAPVSAGRSADLTTCLGRRPDPEEIDAALVAGFVAWFDVELRAGRLSDEEGETAARLYAWKYLSAAWTLAGKPGRRERRWAPPTAAATPWVGG